MLKKELELATRRIEDFHEAITSELDSDSDTLEEEEESSEEEVERLLEQHRRAMSEHRVRESEIRESLARELGESAVTVVGEGGEKRGPEPTRPGATERTV